MYRDLVFAATLMLAACNGGGGGGDDCNSCGDDEVCIAEFSADGDTERCEPIPEECGEVGDCGDIDCQGAMYDYCPETTSGYGCSDTFPPTIISCNF